MNGITPNANGITRYINEEDLPPDHVINEILLQIARDIQVIELAFFQRCLGTKEMRWGLRTADQLGQHALEIAQNTLVPELAETIVIAYYQKSYSIRIMPYANVAFIGIPNSCIPTLTSNGDKVDKVVSEDYLAIPHELGHQFFWLNKKSDFNQKILRERENVHGLPEGIQRWLEEIFADVFGAIIAGPIIGLDFQILQMRKSLEDFYNNDGHHPTPEKRPEIYNRVLDKEFPVATEKLKQKWTEHKKNRKRSSQSQTQVEQTEKIKQKDLDQAIDECLNMLQDLNILDAHHKKKISIKFWSDFAQKSATLEVDQILEEFSKYLKDWMNNSSNVAINERPAKDKELISRSYDDLVRIWKDDNFCLKEKSKWPDWVCIFLAGGWTTEGPHTPISPG